MRLLVGVGKSSYRITVRQLESMVRLSEGLAKLYGSDEVLIRHVTEAAYLLKTSIVHIEQEAVTFDDEDTEASAVLRAAEAAEMDIDATNEEAAAADSQMIPDTEAEAEVCIASSTLFLIFNNNNFLGCCCSKSQIYLDFGRVSKNCQLDHDENQERGANEKHCWNETLLCHSMVHGGHGRRRPY